MNDSSTPEAAQPSSTATATTQTADVSALIVGLQKAQNFPLGIIAGVVAAIVGAGIWAGVTYGTGYQIGWMAVGVGFLVGFAIRVAGKGIEQKFGFVGAALALFGCLLGNLLTQALFIADYEKVGVMDVLLSLNSEMIVEIYTVSFSPMDLLFYGIAIYEGYKFSFAQLDSEQLRALKNG